MKFGARTMAGSAARSVAERKTLLRATLLAVLALAAAGLAFAQSLYKSRGPDGEWIYSDKPPDDGAIAEIRDLNTGQKRAEVTVSHRFIGSRVQLLAANRFYAPVELRLSIQNIRGIEYPKTTEELHWVLPAQSTTELLDLEILDNGTAPYLAYRFEYLPGDPAASHRPAVPYRVPYAVASDYPVTQSYPDVITHTTRDSYYAIDLAMPIGTDIFAAREGIVFDVASNSFKGGLDPEIHGPAANVVRILHDDGTYAIYAHLNWKSIRVKPGDRVARGEYIADSGNTGFSSGPHLHFAVLRNGGLVSESVPVVFQGADSRAVTPATGMMLTAY